MKNDMKQKIIKSVKDYFDNLDRSSGGECNDCHDFKGDLIKIIEKTFEDNK